MPHRHVNGVRIHYLDEGDAKQPVMVLLHGLGSSARDWEYQIPDFAAQYRVIAPDFRGFGESEQPPGPYSIALFAEDVWALLDDLGVKAVHLVGLSMGGATAFEMAAQQPRRVTKLVVVNCPPSFVIDSWKNRLELWLRLGVVKFLGMRRMATIIGARLFPRADQREIREVFEQRYAANDKRPYLDAVNALVGWSVLTRLDRIVCPALIISAEHDYTEVDEKQVAVDGLPRGELKVIADSRHATPLDQTEAFNRSVLDFLGRD